MTSSSARAVQPFSRGLPLSTITLYAMPSVLSRAAQPPGVQYIWTIIQYFPRKRNGETGWQGGFSAIGGAGRPDAIHYCFPACLRVK